MINREVILKVSEAFQQDVGYGRARIDHQTRMELDLSIGDVIEIEGPKKTAAVVWRAHPTDEGKKILRIDNLTRKNSGIGLGDSVKIKRAEIKEARQVNIAPLISKGPRRPENPPNNSGHTLITWKLSSSAIKSRSRQLRPSKRHRLPKRQALTSTFLAINIIVNY